MLPRLNQSSMSAPRDAPSFQRPIASTLLLDSLLESVSALLRERRYVKLNRNTQRGPRVWHGAWHGWKGKDEWEAPPTL